MTDKFDQNDEDFPRKDETEENIGITEEIRECFPEYPEIEIIDEESAKYMKFLANIESTMNPYELMTIYISEKMEQILYLIEIKDNLIERSKATPTEEAIINDQFFNYSLYIGDHIIRSKLNELDILDEIDNTDLIRYIEELDEEENKEEIKKINIFLSQISDTDIIRYFFDANLDYIHNSSNESEKSRREKFVTSLIDEIIDYLSIDYDKIRHDQDLGIMNRLMFIDLHKTFFDCKEDFTERLNRIMLVCTLTDKEVKDIIKHSNKKRQETNRNDNDNRSVGQ